LLKVLLELGAHFLPTLGVGDAQDGGGVKGGGEPGVPGSIKEVAAVLGDAGVAAAEGLEGGGAEANDSLGSDESDLGFEPGVAGSDLAGGWPLVQASLAAGLPLEVLDGVGEIDLATIDAGGGEELVEKLAGGADEGEAGEVLLVTGLFADEEERRALGANPGNDLGCGLVEIAGSAGVEVPA
jgi:hypothetical protein